MQPRQQRIRLALAALMLLTAVGRTQPIDAQLPALVVPAKFDAQGFVQFLVPVTVRGNVFWCSLDSGGSWVFRLDTAEALAAGLRPNSTGSNSGPGPDVVRDERVQGVTAQLGTLVLPNLTIVLSPLPEIVPDMDCVFGLGILQDHVAQFDYAKPELRLFEAGSFQPPPKATAVPFELDRNRLPYLKTTMRLTADDSVAASLILDTGASYYGAVLMKRFVEEQNVRRRAGPVVAQASDTPGLVLSAVRLGALRVGSFEMRGPSSRCLIIRRRARYMTVSSAPASSSISPSRSTTAAVSCGWSRPRRYPIRRRSMRAASSSRTRPTAVTACATLSRVHRPPAPACRRATS